MLSFKHYQVDPKEIKCPLQRWGKHEAIFHIVGLPNLWDYLGHELRLKGFFFSKHIFTLEEMSFTIKKFREIDFCEHKLVK
jgi:hypothetical protein